MWIIKFIFHYLLIISYFEIFLIIQPLLSICCQWTLQKWPGISGYLSSSSFFILIQSISHYLLMINFKYFLMIQPLLLVYCQWNLLENCYYFSNLWSWSLHKLYSLYSFLFFPFTIFQAFELELMLNYTLFYSP